MKRRVLSLFLVLFISINSLMFSCKSVKAAMSTTELIGFILSVTGAVDLVSGGGVQKIAGSVRDELSETISDLMGTGIYTDSDGNYVFSNSATEAIYDVLRGSSDTNTRVVSDFQGLTPMAGLYYFGNPDMNLNIKNFINSNRTLYSSYLVSCSLTQNSYTTFCNCTIIDLTNVAYIRVYNNNSTYGGLQTYGKNGNVINCNYTQACFSSYYGYKTKSSSTSSFNIVFQYPYSNADTQDYLPNVAKFNIDNDYSNVDANLASNILTNFPYYGNNGGSLFWSNRSLLICDNANKGFDKYNYPSGVVFANTYNTLPSVNTNVISNNNWDSIYNNYVSSVSSNVSNFYDVTTNQYNYDEMYKYIKTFNNNITNEVNAGNTDIEQSINYNNQWLSLIYDRLGTINVKLDNLSSGGGNEVWTQQDISDIKASLLRLENSLTQEYSKLEAIYTYLSVLNTSIQSISSSSDPINIYNDYSDYYDILVDLPVSDVDDIIDKGDTVKELIPTVAPFSYLNLASNILSDMTATPQEPSFTIPLSFTHNVAGVDHVFDEDMQLDLSDFTDIRLLCNGFFVILFIFGLCFISVRIIKMMMDLLEWG